MAYLRIRSDTLGDIRDVIRYLSYLEQAYNHVYALDLILEEAKRRYDELNEYGCSRKKPLRSLPTIKKVNEVILPDDRLRVLSIAIQSPGFWEFMGNINPLEVIRKYLCDRHERIKDVQYRNELERMRETLEIERLRLAVVHDRIDILKELGVPQEKIRATLFEHVITPLGQLDGVQDKGLIRDAESTDGDNNELPKWKMRT